MLRGFKATKCVFFTMDGRLPIKGNSGGGDKVASYWKLFQLIAKEAVKEQKWDKTAQGIYICIYIYVNARNKKDIENKRFALREPRIPVIVNRITKALTGIVYEKEIQIIAMQVFKEFDEEQRLEVFIGLPADWEGIENDLQKAE